MDRNARWAVIFIVALALAGTLLVVSAGSASAAKISGTVTDSGRTPVPGATVTLYQNNQVYVTANNPATTDVAGYYLFPVMPPGNYSAIAEMDGYTYSSTVRLDSADLTLDLQIPGYTYTPAVPTTPPHVITVLPTPTPTATPMPTPTPTPKPSNTPVPLPIPPAEPGFGMLLAVIALGLMATVTGSLKR